MELNNSFANLSENLSAKFPDLDEFYLSVQILGYVSGLYKGTIWVSSSSKPIVSLINFDKEIIQKIEESPSFSIEQLSEKEKKDLCKYFLERCLKFERRIENSPENPVKFCDELLLSDPQAVSNNKGDYLVSFSKLSEKSQKKYADWDIERYFYYKTPLIPIRINETIVALADPKNGQTIYDPNCGDGSLFVEFYKKFPDFDFNFNGVAGTQFEWLFCIVNLYVNGILDDRRVEVEIEVNSPLQDTPQWYYELKSGEGYSLREIADIAVSFVPFKMKLIDGELDSRFFGLSYSLKQPEYAYIELMLNAVRDTGKAIAIVPDSVLYSSEGRFFREAYLSRDWIEGVISLPANFFNQDAFSEASIVVFNKNKTEKGFVTFKSENGQFEETKVNLEEILSLDRLDLRASRYVLKDAKELKNILANTPYPVIKIRDIIQNSVSGVNYSPKSRIDENSVDDLPYVRVSNLAKNETQFDLDVSKVERKISRKKANKKTVIDYSAVLVSKITPKLKSTYFKFTGQPIVIGSDIIALKMKEDIVSVEYFITQLHSRLVQIQVEMFSSGTTINRITEEDFLNIQILLPSLEEQKHRAEEFRDSVFKVAKEVIEAESERDEAEYQTIANINHSLKNKLGAIVGGYDTLVRFLKRKERENAPVRFDEPVFPLREGESIQDVDTIATITERLKKHLLDASNVFNSFEKIEQKRHLQKEPVELVGYFQNELKSLYSGKNYTIEVLAKPKLKLNVLIDKEDFKDIIENLIENARKHGFISEDRKYKVVFELSKQEDVYDEASESYTNYARILYKNDGKPFPKGFSFDEYIEYSNKAGKTQGTGIGGSIVFRQIKQHGGKLNCISIDENDSLFPIQFEILLPLDD